jgi:hypothetical protein
MPLTLHFSDPLKSPITVPDYPPGIDVIDTSLTLVGKGYPNYAQKFAENFLHLLENFASANPPANPVEGQLWYDSGNKVLKIMDGTANSVRWPNATGIYQQADDPTTSNISGLKNGDMWVDTLRNQVKIYSENGWTLIGPCATNLSTDSNGNVVATITTTGSFPTTEIDNRIPPLEHLVIENYVNGKVISIISADSFTPKKIISGFGINPVVKGINLSTGAIINGISLASQYLDTSKLTNIQFQGSNVIAAGNFLRKEDTSQTGQVITGKVNLRNGTSGGLVFSSPNNAETSRIVFLENNTTISNSANASSIILNINGTDLLTVSSVLTTINNSLQVTGNQSVTGAFTSTGIITGGSDLNILGNITSQGNINSSGSMQLNGQLYVNGSNGQAGPAILPGTASSPANNKFDIGSSSASFNAVYARSVGVQDGSTTFIGNLVGKSKFADELTRYTRAQLVGAVTSEEFIFNGDGSLRDKHGFNIGKSINVTLSSGAFTSLPVKTDNNNTTTNILAYDTSKSELFQLPNNIFLPGMIMPYGGDTAPPGWLLCNGVTVSSVDNAKLFAVIGYKFGGSGPYFSLPDMRHATAGEGILVNYIIKT